MGCTQSTDAGGGMTETERIMGSRRGIDKSERIPLSAEDRAKRKALIEEANKKRQQNGEKAAPKLNGSGQLMAEEVAKRISGTVESKDCVVGDLKCGDDDAVTHISYAALTQRGYYPDNPHKENQDSYTLLPTGFASGEGDAFFARGPGSDCNFLPSRHRLGTLL